MLHTVSMHLMSYTWQWGDKDGRARVLDPEELSLVSGVDIISTVRCRDLSRLQFIVFTRAAHKAWEGGIKQGTQGGSLSSKL